MIRAIFAALIAIAASTAAAQSPPARDGSELTIYLLTIGPGDQVWEKFGHNAIWIHDEYNHTNIAYHWGLFDFADKDFIPRFVQGRMRYSMGEFDMSQTVEDYRQANRTVWVQRLNFTPAQRLKLAEFVAWNVRPENRYYHYDYFRDNCSTRVRDALNAALGGVIKRETENVPSHTTYRFHTARLTQDDWPVFTGTMMGLGQPVDRQISAWEEMFLPVRMMIRLRSVRVPGAVGMQPLVEDERVLFEATRRPEDTRVRRGITGYLLTSLLILAVGVLVWIRGGKNGRHTAVLALAALWSFLAGLAGALLAGLWAFTDHVYSYHNENLLQLNPLSLVVAILVIRLMLHRRRAPSATPGSTTIGAAAVVAVLSIIGFAAQALPWFYQVNGYVIALALPLHLGLAAALFLLAREGQALPLQA